MRKKTLKIVMIVCALLLVGFTTWHFFVSNIQAEPLSETEVRSLVQEMYQGEIIDVSKERSKYELNVSLKNKIYTISVNRQTGEIMSIHQHDSEGELREFSKDEIKQLVLQQYQGDIKKIDKKMKSGKVFYQVLIQDKVNEIQLKVNAHSGEMERISSKEIPIGEKETELKVKLTESEATNIALENISGEVDDVDLEDSDGFSYYLIDIERADGQEATIQINAITGEIISITWDD